MSLGDRPEAPLHPQARDPLSCSGMNQPPAGTDAQATLEGIRGVGVSQGPGLQPISTSLVAEGARADSGDIALAPG